MKFVAEEVDVAGLVDLLESLKKKQDEAESSGEAESDKKLWDALDAWEEVGEIEKAVSG